MCKCVKLLWPVMAYRGIRRPLYRGWADIRSLRHPFDAPPLFSCTLVSNGRLVLFVHNLPLGLSLILYPVIAPKSAWFRNGVRQFSLNQFPQASDYTIRVVSNFFENSRRYSQLKVCHRCQRLANISANFRKNSKRSNWNTLGWGRN